MTSYVPDSIASDGSGLTFGGTLPTVRGLHDLVLKDADGNELTRVPRAVDVQAYLTSISPTTAEAGVFTEFTVTGGALLDTDSVYIEENGAFSPEDVTNDGFTFSAALYDPAPLGPLDVMVNLSGEVTLTDAITVTGAATITSVTPNTVSAAAPSATVVTVVGTNLAGVYEANLIHETTQEQVYASMSNLTATGFVFDLYPGSPVGVYTLSLTNQDYKVIATLPAAMTVTA